MRILVSVLLAAALCAAMLSGCGDDCTSPNLRGQIRVSLNMSGGEPDTSGCTVTLDDAVTKTMLADESVVFSNLDVGSHVVRLDELSGNCNVSGENPRVIKVNASRTTETVFDVSCEDTPFGRIAFTSDRRSYNHDIWVVHADGSNPINLTPVGGTDNWAA